MVKPEMKLRKTEHYNIICSNYMNNYLWSKNKVQILNQRFK